MSLAGRPPLAKTHCSSSYSWGHVLAGDDCDSWSHLGQLGFLLNGLAFLCSPGNAAAAPFAVYRRRGCAVTANWSGLTTWASLELPSASSPSF